MAEFRANRIGERPRPTGQVAVAIVIVVVSFSLLAAAALPMVFAARGLPAAEQVQVHQQTFNQLMAVIAAWVGAIIAFYFSRDNLNAVTQGYRDLVVQASGEEKLKSLSSTDKMITYDEIDFVELVTEEVSGRKVSRNTLEQLIRIADNGRTRIPIRNTDGTIVYVVHRSILYEFIAVCTGKLEGPPASWQLQSLLDQFRIQVSALAFVRQGATLAEAKAAMAAQGPHCQDVFVTKTGSRREPILGWLPHTRIIQLSND